MKPSVQTKPNGDLVLIVAEPFMSMLRDLPAILDSAREHPRARRRMFPDAYSSDDANREWRKHSGDALAHLFDSGRELVRKDLDQAKRGVGVTAIWKIEIAKTHHNAWMSSLNAARLVLGEIHRVTEKDMETTAEIDDQSERGYALLRIHLLGWIEELLVGEALR